jgi:AraC family transcriptional regulator, melibiose operon regulatory protein
VRFDPTRPDFAPYGLTCERWTPSLMRRPDRHNEVELNLLDSGAVTYLLGGRKVTIEAGRLAVFWAAVPHQIIDARVKSPYFVATLPLAWFLQAGLPDRLVQPILHAQVISDPSPDPARDRKMFEQWLGDLHGRREERRRAAMLEMEARLLRLAMALPANRLRRDQPPRRRSIVEAERLSKAEQMACFIAQHYLEPLTIDDITAPVQLHPNYAMNLFKRVFGTTLTRYLSQHRISHAQRLLATTDQKVLTIALDSGFGSISRFNDVFRRTCGCSPRRYRGDHRLV